VKTKLSIVVLSIICLALCALAGEPQASKGKKLPLSNLIQQVPAPEDRYVSSVSEAGKRLLDFMARIGVNPRASGSSSIGQVSSAWPFSTLTIPRLEDVQRTGNNIRWDREFNTVRFIDLVPQMGPRSTNPLATSDAIARARKFLQAEKSVLRMTDPQAEFSVTSAERDELGVTHVRFQQVYNGIEVWAKDIYVHVDDYGRVLSMNGRYVPTPTVIQDVTGRVSREEAINTVQSDLSGRMTLEELSPFLKEILDYKGPTARRIIWHDALHQPHLVWLVEVRPSLDQDWYYFIDANSSAILHFYNNVSYDGPAIGSGVDLNGQVRTFGTYQVGATYYMIDASQPMFNAAQSRIPQDPVGAIVNLDLRNSDLSSQSQYFFVTSPNNQWTDAASVSSHFNAIVTYNYFRTTHNRNSVDNKGMTIYSIIHVTDKKRPLENAFWAGKFMCYGDGQSLFKPLAGALDVAAHEMTHGVTQHSANLEYQEQSGALNESFSDAFAAMVDVRNWTIGEDIIKDHSTFPSGALRDLSNPHNGGIPGSSAWQPARMSEFLITVEDNGGVHINSGIPNRALYLVAQALGRPKAERIWYRTLTNYLTRSSQFLDARFATMRAATDLYGASSAEVTSVKNSWDAVEVFDSSPPPPPPTTKPQGTEWLLVTNTDPKDPNSLYRAKINVQSQADFFPLSKTGVFNRPAVSDDGQIAVFVDNKNNLRVLLTNPQNPQEQLLDTSGVWYSVALGPGLSSIALTSIYIDTTIYYLDLVHQQVRAFKIETQSFDTPNARTALYADALSFDPTGQFLLFDAFNQITGTRDTLSFWNINLLNISTGRMASVFAPQPKGVDIGNPAFSKSSPTRFTCDLRYSDLDQDYPLGVDFNIGRVGIVAGPLPTLGYPTYSGNDQTIAYHTQIFYQGAQHDAVSKMPLQADLLTGTGTPETHSIDATFPVWFVIGIRVGVQEDQISTFPQSPELSQNYPNPFNPSTTIEFALPRSRFVSLKVFNILGGEVATLISGEHSPGRYKVEWNASNLASGLYFYRLQAGPFVETKKLILLR